MSNMQRYFEEYEKYKNVELDLDVVYLKKSKASERVMLLKIYLQLTHQWTLTEHKKFQEIYS